MGSALAGHLQKDGSLHVHSLGSGDVGVRETIVRMAAIVRAAIRRPIVIATARNIVLNAHGQTAQAYAIRDWLSKSWRFVDDPLQLEYLVKPHNLLADAALSGVVVGDCDDAAILGASLGAAVGIQPYFVVLGFAEEDDRLCHVYASLLTVEDVSIELDITRPANMELKPSRREVFPIF